MRGIFALILFSPLLFPLNYRRVNLTLYSSSDWAVVRFSSRRIALCSKIKPDYPGLRCLPDAIVLNQPLGEEREIRMEVYFYGGEDEEDILVEKGYAGKVELEFSWEGEKQVLKDELHRDAFNRKKFRISIPGSFMDRNLRFSLTPRVLSFYYPWYGTPWGPSHGWLHWDLCGHRPWEGDLASAHTPLLGPYDSRDPSIIRQHISWARMGGIDAFILPCFGRDRATWEGIRAFLRVAEEEKFPYALSFPFPDYPYQVSPEGGAEIVRDALREFSSQLYIKVHGRPLVFFYAANALPRSFWRRFFRKLRAEGMEVFSMGNFTDPSYGEIFDGGYFYLPVFFKKATRNLQMEYFSWLRALGILLDKPYFFSLFPGFDKRTCGKGPLIPRREGRTLLNLAYPLISLFPHWLLASTFNEWHEGTEFEPSKEYGFFYLEMLSVVSQEFRANAKVRR